MWDAQTQQAVLSSIMKQAVNYLFIGQSVLRHSFMLINIWKQSHNESIRHESNCGRRKKTFEHKFEWNKISLLSLSDRTVALCVWVVDCTKVLFLMSFWLFVLRGNPASCALTDRGMRMLQCVLCVSPVLSRCSRGRSTVLGSWYSPSRSLSSGKVCMRW